MPHHLPNTLSSYKKTAPGIAAVFCIPSRASILHILLNFEGDRFASFRIVSIFYVITYRFQSKGAKCLEFR